LRIDGVLLAALCMVASIGFFRESRGAIGGFDASASKVQIETLEFSQYPIPRSVYESTGGMAFEKIPGRIEFPNLTFSFPSMGVPLPAPGETIEGGALVDMVLTSTEHDNIADYGRAVVARVSAAPPPADLTALGSGSSVPNGMWSIELSGLEFRGEIMGPGGPLMATLRESPTLASLGQHMLTDLPDGGLHIDSFFDIFWELSLDGDPFTPAEGPVRLGITTIVPEPASAILLGMASMTITFCGRRRRRGFRA
jgi:hypothetical protein